MPTICEGVSFDTIAREWRCKWSPDDDKKSLVEAQKAFEAVHDELKSVTGLKEVKRVVCGGCLDFKIVIALEADSFGAFEGSSFGPEPKFLAMLKEITGISCIETQTYTFMNM
eukprot:CAMPEP_0119302238 /NCGR_PEP_ID=MMETSP1333-20130426/3873_1 /TAXON_ID=418940 /ORGANISM="Scyphosphaera apsteinii, Strain RCC1455" /LENGTH=112 /DNA_ID=CAMNT_0007304535 /DNA_START=110 /DNA_END=448 /DNA_ORIENTATION=+